ncbi:MAG: cysteine protease [Clostridia bacterium]|nr:cysteine protease [Clostridia bacterium]
MSYKYRYGWIPDYPDIRDYTSETKQVSKMLNAAKSNQESAALPARIDLRKWCSPIENQKDLGSCTAHAVAALVEYFENRTFAKFIDGSRLFLYKTTRNLLKYTGDTGAFLRTTIGALVMFGMPPEEYWPYETTRFDEEPNAFCYAFGQNYQCISYFRHDPPNLSKKEVLDSVKKYLNAGIPAAFGFSVYQSIRDASQTGRIPFPNGKEKLEGGHAVAAVGYDDEIEIVNKGGIVSKGAILIRNSWGSEWGENGYGWLPYDYILNGLAVDWWSILKQEWVDLGRFTE